MGSYCMGCSELELRFIEVSCCCNFEGTAPNWVARSGNSKRAPGFAPSVRPVLDKIFGWTLRLCTERFERLAHPTFWTP